MKMKTLKIPALILAIGLVLAVAVSLFANAFVVPAVTEQAFPYSVTYQLNGETKTMEGIYKCTYEGCTDNCSRRNT